MWIVLFWCTLIGTWLSKYHSAMLLVAKNSTLYLYKAHRITVNEDTIKYFVHLNSAKQANVVYTHCLQLCRLYHRVHHWLLVTAQTGRLKSARSRMASCLSALQPRAVTRCCWMSPPSLCRFDRRRSWRLSVSSLRPICFLTRFTRKVNMLLLGGDGWLCFWSWADVLVWYWYFMKTVGDSMREKSFVPILSHRKHSTFICLIKEKQLQVTTARGINSYFFQYICVDRGRRCVVCIISVYVVSSLSLKLFCIFPPLCYSLVLPPLVFFFPLYHFLSLLFALALSSTTS